MRVAAVILILPLLTLLGTAGCKPKSPKTYNGPVDKEFKTFSGRNAKKIKRVRD